MNKHHKLLFPCLLLALVLPPVLAEDTAQPTNRLANSPNPYLLQHAHNPVDWYPWGEEALAKAKRENKPIFISVGYSTCYWCHVAEREIYAKPDIAKLMNQWFVNIKIDREERPDLDRIYMLATQTLTNGGGWPNNVFLTPDQKPFFAGSYFPPADHDGQPGFPRVLETLHKAWETDPATVQAKADWLYELLRDYQSASVDIASRQQAIGQWVKQAMQRAAGDFDELQGGFTGGGTTKFPNEPKLGLLLAAYPYDQQQGKQALHVLEGSLNAMAAGGIMDQLGGGFHRYSTDPGWDVPHFEKMLYNNAQLLGLYARAYAITRQPLYKQVAQRTAAYLTREMQAPGGGFYSAQDAAVNGVEGASYVWTKAQLEATLGAEDSQRFLGVYDISPMPELPAGHEQPDGGVLRLRLHAKQPPDATQIAALEPLRERLLQARQQRPQPSRDDKLIMADNALAVIGFAQAGQALRDDNLTQTATQTAEWLWEKAFDAPSGGLHHQFYHGKPGGQGFLDDYALLGQAFSTLHRVSGDARWQTRAQQVADAMLKRFAQADGRLVSSQDKSLLLEPPEDGDSTKPTGQSAAIALLLELATTVKPDGQAYAVAARKALGKLYPQVNPAPAEWGALLAALVKPHQMAALTNASPDALATVDPLDSAAHVKASGKWQTGAGKAPVLQVTLHIDTGYHVNANPASAPDLVATRLRLEGQADLSVDYPQGKAFKGEFSRDSISVYDGTVVLQAHLPAKAGALPGKASVDVQACNAQNCLAPAGLEVLLEQ